MKTRQIYGSKKRTPIVRKFNGMYYTFHSAHRTKEEAERQANRIRKDGDLARVVKSQYWAAPWKVWWFSYTKIQR